VASPRKLSDSEIEDGKNIRFRPLGKICEQKSWELCYEPGTNTFNVMVIGDSHSVDGLNAMVAEYPKFDYSLASVPGCIIDKEFKSSYARTYPQYDDCVKMNEEKYFNPKFLSQFDLVVINILYGGENEGKLIAYLKYLKGQNIQRVVIFGGGFTFSEPLPQLINNFGYNREKIMGYVVDNSTRDSSFASASKNMEYFFVSKRDSFCSSKLCEFWNADGTPMTWDKHHLSLEFSSKMLMNITSSLDKYIGIYLKAGLK
jgi:hypothetical protein